MWCGVVMAGWSEFAVWYLEALLPTYTIKEIWKGVQNEVLVVNWAFSSADKNSG